MIEWNREMAEGFWLIHFESHEGRKPVAVRYTEKLCGESYLGWGTTRMRLVESWLLN